jgi:uncharacterized membrane protein
MAETTEVALETQESTWRASLFGLATAVCFASSPIFIRGGLEGLPSPLLGVTVGMSVCTLAYGALLLLRRNVSDGSFGSVAGRVLLLQLIAGIFVGLSTWARWVALDLAPVAVVLALGRINVPQLLILAPLMVGRKLERVTPRVWLGAMLIVAGSLLLIFFG